MRQRVLITAGPTHEPIDRVRYLANRSSGRTGLALAEAAVRRGHATTLLLGPVSTAVPPRTPEDSHLAIQRFRTTEDLRRLLRDSWPEHDVLIMAAAVADYRPAGPREGKIRRSDEGIVLELEPTPDLLAELAETTRPDQRLIGFALENPVGMEAAARDKLERKRLFAIVANPLDTMDSDRITAVVLFADGRRMETPPDISKETFAAWLLEGLMPAA